MAKTRIHTSGNTFQRFTVNGVYNNKILGTWDTNATNVDESKVATLNLSANSTPSFVSNVSPFVANYWGATFTKTTLGQHSQGDTLPFQGMILVPGSSNSVTKPGIVKNLTTSPQIVRLQDPIGNNNTRYVGAGTANSYGIYGGYFYTNPDAPTVSVTGRCHWDLNGNLISKNHSYVAMTVKGALTEDLVRAYYTPPSGYVIGGFQPLKHFVVITLWKLTQFGTPDKENFQSAYWDPTGGVTSKNFIDTRFKKNRILSISDDGRYVSFYTYGLDPVTNTLREKMYVIDNNNTTYYDVKVMLGMNSGAAYRVDDVKFTSSNGLICSTYDIEVINSVTTATLNIELLTNWQ